VGVEKFIPVVFAIFLLPVLVLHGSHRVYRYIKGGKCCNDTNV